MILWINKLRNTLDVIRGAVCPQARFTVVGIAGVLTLATWMPMALAALGAPVNSWEAFVYNVCTPLCHQYPERSFHAAEHVFPLCARCTGMWLGITTGVAVAMLWVKRFRWITGIVVACIAFAVSVSDFVSEVQTGQDSPATRAVAGFALTAAICWAVSFDILAVLLIAFRKPFCQKSK